MKPGRATTWQRAVRDALTARIGLKATALFLAVVLWVIVSAREPAEEVIPVRLVILAEDGIELRDVPPSARALVAGRGRELLRLYREPPSVRVNVPADSPERFVVQLTPDLVELPAGVEASVREVTPRRFTLRLRRTGAE